MKLLRLKLSFIMIMVGLFTFELSAQINSQPTVEKEVSQTRSNEVTYENLPPFVKEFMYKAYEVKPEDVDKIQTFPNGVFLVKLKNPVNVFSINNQMKMTDHKLDYIDITAGNNMLTKKVIQKPIQKKRIRQHINTQEIAWTAIDRNVREYLSKRLLAAEHQVHKVYNLGNDTYKIVLKEAHDQFVIVEAKPYQIAFEHYPID